MIEREAVEITLHIHEITENYFLVSDNGETEDSTWIGRGLVEVEYPV